MGKQDGLTVINNTPLISPEKIKDKTLDQMSLPERTDLLREAYQLIEEGGETTPDELEIIGMLQERSEEKIASWGLVILKNKEAAEFCKIEVDYYKKKAAEAEERYIRFHNKQSKMSAYIQEKMVEFNLKKIETPMLTVSLRKKPQKVELLESADINNPENSEFVLTTVSQRWDKKAIKEKLKTGQLFESVKLSDPEFSLQIKGS